MPRACSHTLFRSCFAGFLSEAFQVPISIGWVGIFSFFTKMLSLF